MLIIPAYLAQSRIHGLGVFTRVAVAKGQIVSRFIPPFDVNFPPELLPALTPAEREYLGNFAYRSKFSLLYVLTGDHDRYMNHSENPNVIMNPDETATCVAAHDLVPDEELTCDYRTFDADWRLKLPSLC